MVQSSLRRVYSSPAPHTTVRDSLTWCEADWPAWASLAIHHPESQRWDVYPRPQLAPPPMLVPITILVRHHSSHINPPSRISEFLAFAMDLPDTVVFSPGTFSDMYFLSARESTVNNRRRTSRSRSLGVCSAMICLSRMSGAQGTVWIETRPPGYAGHCKTEAKIHRGENN